MERNPAAAIDSPIVQAFAAMPAHLQEETLRKILLERIYSERNVLASYLHRAANNLDLEINAIVSQPNAADHQQKLAESWSHYQALMAQISILPLGNLLGAWDTLVLAQNARAESEHADTSTDEMEPDDIPF